jgi:hypothetical protein
MDWVSPSRQAGAENRGQLGGEKNGAKSRFLIKAQMFKRKSQQTSCSSGSYSLSAPLPPTVISESHVQELCCRSFILIDCAF